MAGPLILHIETATDICSVALAEGEQLLQLIESGPERSHAVLLNSFIKEALEKAEMEPGQLDAISVSKGPGSYTGLRIGVSTAKGFAYALSIPLLATGTLENMASGSLNHAEVLKIRQEFGEKILLCPMLDARRMEVYAGFYDIELKVIREVAADIVETDTYESLLEKHHICFFGNGASKCREVLIHPNAHFIADVDPSAGFMLGPALQRYVKEEFEDVAYFEPFYLKDFVATIPRKKVL